MSLVIMTEVDAAVGRNIRKLRHIAGMTQEQLANAIGVKFQQVQKYETGANRIAASRLVSVCKTLQCGLEQIFEGIDDVVGGDLPTIPAEELDMLAAFRKLPAEKRQSLMTLIGG